MNKSSVPLEDNFGDILGKAMRGLGIGAADLATRAGLSENEVRAVLGGEVRPQVIPALAIQLGLDPGRLLAIAQGAYRPAAVSLPAGLAWFRTRFEDMEVNAYLVWDEDTREAAAFDTGADVGEMLRVVSSQRLALRALLLTHSHRDHIHDLGRLKTETGCEAWTGEGEECAGAHSFRAGQEFRVGGLRIGTRPTIGHARGGITYVIEGLTRKVAVVGDAMFAGSMGGAMVSYRDALETGRGGILSLPDSTIVCPGHGPLTTVGEQKMHNPFFPDGTARA